MLRIQSHLLISTACACLALVACAPKEEKKAAGGPATLVTTTTVSARSLEVTEDTLGTLESLIDPTVGAEVPGRVVRVLTRAGQKVRRGDTMALLDPSDLALALRSDKAELQRLKSLLEQQERLVQRQKDLVGKGFVSRNAVDDAVAQRDALRAQLAAAQARADSGRSNQGKARVVAPIDGEVDAQIVATGDYVKVGDPLFKMVSNRRLRAILPYPETAAARIRRGQPVRITSPQSPGLVVSGKVEDIRPVVSAGSRAVDVLVRFDNEAGLLAGGTINGSVLIDLRDNAVLVPEQSVVLRPAGTVVYAIADSKAVQRIVTTGARKAGMVEITKGLAGGETVALDGAGFLSDGAAVSIKETAKQAAAPKQ
ncbi:MAG: efflux RND transporter periplasmic adaptor subunit [Candidatus Methylophosphatis roskildensis]